MSFCNKQISVIIPTLNEEDCIGTLLECLKSQRDVCLEIIVADGGSADNTIAISKKSGAAVVSSTAGRARQMNTGANAASNELLLFLHSDSSFAAEDALSSCRNLPINSAGHFELSFVGDLKASHPLACRFYEAKTRTGLPGTIHGDQGLLIHNELFQQLGGFDETLPFFEDEAIADAVFSNANWVLLPAAIQTSTRRFEDEGFCRRMVLSSIMMALRDVQFWEFFSQAKQVYSADKDKKPLQVANFCKLLHSLLGNLSVAARFKFWIKAGRYIKGNIWQLALWLEVAAGCNAHRVFDKYFRPVLKWPVFDFVAGVIAVCGFYCIWMNYWIKDRDLF